MSLRDPREAKMSDEQYAIYVELAITGFEEDPDDLTSLIGLSPTKIGRKGERMNGKVGVVLKSNRWVLSIPFDRMRGYVLDSHLAELLRIIEPHTIAIRELTSRTESYICCAVYDGDRETHLFVSSPTLRAIADLNLPLDIDTYAFGLATP